LNSSVLYAGGKSSNFEIVHDFGPFKVIAGLIIEVVEGFASATTLLLTLNELSEPFFL